jgi:hypothetical protein
MSEPDIFLEAILLFNLTITVTRVIQNLEYLIETNRAHLIKTMDDQTLDFLQNW